MFSMMVHSASRLGLVSYLYQQRHEIAYTLGMIAEIPIAVCSGDYDFYPGPIIQEAQAQDSSMPPAMLLAHEIQLFCSAHTDIQINPARLATDVIKCDRPTDSHYATPAQGIFHPPS